MMNLGLLLVPGAIALLAAAAWGILAAAGRLDRPVAIVGIRNGLVIGLLLGLAITVVLTLYLNGRSFVGSPLLDLGGAFSIGLVAGGMLGLLYVAIGALLMPVGLLVGLGRAWATVWVWLATPLLVAVVVALYLSF
ncbi:MAG TPA: hypothetical protein VNW68_06350 [Candidatus Limnocylindria bacterium]|nr:hypothetical protein [Candidatus Limnocylindria bacterium]